MCIRNSQKYRWKQIKFLVWASNCFLPWEILSQPLWKSHSYVREILSFPTMWQRNVSFRNFLCLFPYFWNWIKNRPGSLALLSAREFFSNRKFLMLSLLSLFSKVVQATNSPFSVSPSSLRRKSGLKFQVFGVTPYQNKNRNRLMN